jgi:hypothetical protein
MLTIEVKRLRDRVYDVADAAIPIASQSTVSTGAEANAQCGQLCRLRAANRTKQVSRGAHHRPRAPVSSRRSREIHSPTRHIAIFGYGYSLAFVRLLF